MNLHSAFALKSFFEKFSEVSDLRRWKENVPKYNSSKRHTWSNICCSILMLIMLLHLYHQRVVNQKISTINTDNINQMVNKWTGYQVP